MVRSMKGQKRSKPNHNLEGEQEGVLKQERKKDRVWASKFKKRHRKDLSVEELEEILEETKKPYLLFKDIANKHNVSFQFVSRLVQESKKKPEKLQKRRVREQ